MLICIFSMEIIYFLKINVANLQQTWYWLDISCTSLKWKGCIINSKIEAFQLICIIPIRNSANIQIFPYITNCSNAWKVGRVLVSSIDEYVKRRGDEVSKMVSHYYVIFSITSVAILLCICSCTRATLHYWTRSYHQKIYLAFARIKWYKI